MLCGERRRAVINWRNFSQNPGSETEVDLEEGFSYI